MCLATGLCLGRVGKSPLAAPSFDLRRERLRRAVSLIPSDTNCNRRIVGIPTKYAAMSWRHVLYYCHVWLQAEGRLPHLVGLRCALSHKWPCQAHLVLLSLACLSFVLRCSSLETTTCPRYPGYSTPFFNTLFNRLLDLLCPKNEPEARPRSKSVCAESFSCPSRTRAPRPSTIAHHSQTR
jgi:hypothetical protein